MIKTGRPLVLSWLPFFPVGLGLRLMQGPNQLGALNLAPFFSKGSVPCPSAYCTQGFERSRQATWSVTWSVTVQANRNQAHRRHLGLGQEGVGSRE